MKFSLHKLWGQQIVQDLDQITRGLQVKLVVLWGLRQRLVLYFCSDSDMTHLGRGVRARVLPLIQFIPALHQFDDHWVAEVDQLEARHVCAAMHEAFQVDVFKTLEGQEGERAVTSSHRSISGRQKQACGRKDDEGRGIALNKWNIKAGNYQLAATRKHQIEFIYCTLQRL